MSDRKEGQRAQARRWYEKNRERILARMKKDREGQYARYRAYYDKNPYRVTARGMVSKAYKRSLADGTPFCSQVIQPDFITWWLKNTPKCQCCGRLFRVGAKGAIGPQPDSPTLDRIHPHKGYVWRNVALLCWRCNRLKSDATVDELARIVEWMRRHG